MRSLQDVKNEYVQLCIQIGEKEYQRSMLNKEIPELLGKCEKIQAEAASMIAAQKAADTEKKNGSSI